MKIKKLALTGIMALTLMAPLALTGCVERTEESTTTIDRTNPAPVVVPDNSDVDVNVHTDTQPAPNIIHKDTSTNTTIERNNDTGIETKTKTESTTVH
jgi:hypothetical protein